VKGLLLKRFRTAGRYVTERDLCDGLGASRGAVREALLQLEQQGLIERRQKTGTALREPSLKELIDLWDLRCGLEAVAVRLACERITRDDIAALQSLCERRGTAARKTGDDAKVNGLDIAFHELIIEKSGNQVIFDMVRQMHLFDRIFRIGYTVPAYLPEDENAAFGHRRIIAAIEARDADAAEDLMKRHIQGAKKRRVESLVGKIDLYEPPR
jgi:DNA-binding GntR family transcriptional regulator